MVWLKLARLEPLQKGSRELNCNACRLTKILARKQQQRRVHFKLGVLAMHAGLGSSEIMVKPVEKPRLCTYDLAQVYCRPSTNIAPN